MTQTHFAGLNTAAFAAALEGRPVLVSYADVVRRPGVWADEILPRLQAGAYTSAILDSGAFTELTTPGFSVSIDAYVAFCQAHGHLFDQVVTLDDIAGDLATTWKNTAALEAAGLDVVPVFHGREPWAVLDHYCKRYRRVGLGFARDAGRIAKDQGEGLSPDAWLERALAVCEAHGVAVHGFGMTRYARERGHARLTTTDSTTWIAEYRALRNHRDATHSVSGDAAALLGPYLDEDLVQVVLWSYLGTGADAEVDACIAGASGQARTVLRRFNGEELARVLAMIDARAAAQRAEIRAASQASGSVCEPAQVDEEAPTCHFCGDERVLEVFELWPDERAFQIRTCCEAYQEGMREELSDPELLADPVWRRGFATWFEGETGWKVRRPYVSQNDLAIRLDFGLDVCSVTLGEAKAFVAEHPTTATSAPTRPTSRRSPGAGATRCATAPTWSPSRWSAARSRA